jgi:hypothetical protein
MMALAETGCRGVIPYHGQQCPEDYVKLIRFQDTQKYMQKRSNIIKMLNQWQ